MDYTSQIKNHELHTTDATGQHWRQSALNEVLQNRFGSADPAMLQAIQAQVTWHNLMAGETLFRQGDPSHEMYIVVSGRLRLHVADTMGEESPTQDGANNERTVGQVTAGETVGEFGLLTDAPRSASITAVRESTLVSLSPVVFNELLQTYPALSRAVMKIIIERQQRATPTLAQKELATVAVALVPATPELPLDEFAAQLARAWPQDGDLLVLDSERFDQLYGQVGAAYTTSADSAHPSISAWMGKLERQYRYLIYAADYEWTPWTRRCLNQVDQVLLVADATAAPQPSVTEITITQLPARLRTGLALWHPTDTDAPSGTAAWLAVRNVDAHYHLRQNDKAHMARLARHLSGNAICLVLSGGGARGTAHAGVYRAIVELGIPVDAVGGTSAGAMAAGTIANGTPYEVMIKNMGERANAKAMMDYTLPITSLLKSQKINQTCQHFFGDTQIEDLWIPYFCISTNLTHSQQQIHQQGSLWRAVRASMSIPGIFAPVMEKGEMLVDGGVINNFPIDVMAKEVGSPHIIAVNLNPPRTSERPYDLDASISGWRILASRFNPLRSQLSTPTLMKTMMRTITAASDQAARESERLAEVVICPKAKTGGMLNFSNYMAIVEAGYDTALEPLRQWLETHQTLLGEVNPEVNRS